MKKENTEKPAYKNNYLYKAYRMKEYLWLAFTGIALVMAIYELIKGANREESIYLVALTILAGLFYSFNRYRRLKWEKREEQGPKNN